MAREKFSTLTEQMFYVLLSLVKEGCGAEIMQRVMERTDGRVRIGPGTLYNLLEQFSHEGMIRETKAEGRRRSYLLTEKGRQTIDEEYARLCRQVRDYEDMTREEEPT